MRIRATLLLFPVMALVATGALFPAAGRSDETATSSQQILRYNGRVVSVDPSGLSVSVRGDDGFKTFETGPDMVQSVGSGDEVIVKYRESESGRKATSLVVTEKAQGATDAERARAQREENRKQAAERRSQRNAKNHPGNDSVNEDIGYGKGFYVPPDQR